MSRPNTTAKHSFLQFFYQVKLDGILIHSRKNEKPRIYDDVRVYAPNPWQASVNGKLKNLIISERNPTPSGIYQVC